MRERTNEEAGYKGKEKSPNFPVFMLMTTDKTLELSSLSL